MIEAAMLLRREVLFQICCTQIRSTLNLSIFVVIRQKESGRGEQKHYSVTDTFILVPESASLTAPRIQTPGILSLLRNGISLEHKT